MEIINAVRLVTPVPDSHYRLKDCLCGSNQAVYIQGQDRKWRVKCLECGQETRGRESRHGAQIDWNWGRAEHDRNGS